MFSCYRPQRSCDQGYVFTCVCDSVHRGGLQAAPPGQGEPPPGPGRHPPGTGRTTPPRQGEPPRTRQTPSGPGRPPQTRQTPPREEDCSIRSMSGRYASYWNAFLLKLIFLYRVMVCDILIASSEGQNWPSPEEKHINCIFRQLLTNLLFWIISNGTIIF